MGTAAILPLEEMEAYERVRQRLRKLAQTYPGILQIPLADADRKCPICDNKTVIEGDETAPWRVNFHCRTCGNHWTPGQASSNTWLKAQRKVWRDNQHHPTAV